MSDVVKGRDNILPRDLSLLQGRAAMARSSGPDTYALAYHGDTGRRPVMLPRRMVSLRAQDHSSRPRADQSYPLPCFEAADDGQICAFYEAQDALAREISEAREAAAQRPAELRAVIARVAAGGGFAYADVRGVRRGADLARVRHVALFCAYALSMKSLPDIGRCIDRDHTTVLNSLRCAERIFGLPRKAAMVRRIRVAEAFMARLDLGEDFERAVAAVAAARGAP